MLHTSNIIKYITDFHLKNENRLVNWYFLYFLVVFSLDRMINFFQLTPFFVVAGLLVFPLLFLSAQITNRERNQLYVLVCSFAFIGVLNSIFQSFHVKNISDLLFISLFFTMYYYYKNQTESLNYKYADLFFLVSLILIGFTFFSVDADYRALEPFRDITVRAMRRRNDHATYIEELFRVYHNGLFRLPHVASYFFGFLFIYYAYRYQKSLRLKNLVIMIVSLILCFYTGARAIVVVIGFSAFLYALKKNSVITLQLAVIFLLLLVMFRENLMALTEGTVFYQFFSLIQTSVENITHFSRLKIWYSWWIEVSNFGIWDYLIGKSFINAFVANGRNLGYAIWFHNDFLNIFFTYGIGGFVLYTWFFIKIYRDNKAYIKNNIFVFMFYFSMLISAFVNGFYFYFPVFLLYLFFLMIKHEKQKEVAS